MQLTASVLPIYIHVYVHIHKLILPRRLEHGYVFMYTEVSRLVVHNSFTLIQLHTPKNTQRKLYILYVHVLTEYDAYTPFSSAGVH